ncbi:dihydrolipoamide acetyltransferase family protein [Streptomyces sp. NRRL S-340]|uniref:dihydrolipoamide acetyltransferase family protein n=1 Tax=Streptomyces sp. NRRL S-340 TaxID=1463901 RepID=UPI00056C00EB|nr:dihydrolipoamide acetyltransferase family protein [Streptomyces sp. NRRL S-340]
MAQVLEFRLPDLGEGLTEAEIVRWMVEVGDVVAVDQPVVEVETAKAMVEVPCPYGGVVTARFGEEGAELPVGAPLLTVAVGEESAGSPAPAAGGAAGGGAGGSGGGSGAGGSSGPGSGGGSGNVLVGYGTAEAPARRRRVRAVPGAPSAAAGRPAAGAPAPGAPGASRAASVPDTPVIGRPADGPVPVISPLVRRLAREHGLDLRRLPGSGPDGLILRSDVEAALKAASTAPAAALTGLVADPTGPSASGTPGSAASGSGVLGTAASGAGASASGRAPTAAAGTRVALKGVRGAVADKLSRSRREIPDATCWVDADATELLRARAAMNAAGGPKISLLALLARICTAALARHPELNSTVDTEAREIVRLDHVHLGFAAQTERGLVVPVVRDAHARGAEALTAEFARLTEAARTGTLTPGELTGGTFTLNNYGVFGVDGSTPIINHPEAAMLGVGRIVPRPWVHEGELAVRQVVQLSLTFDHRVCDGGTAGGFLRYVADCVEQPAVLLRTL